ncbi:ABC transporter permease [Actinotalea solisilvae]|uniref:ABC transporter permease n=1 Tax=Actinotalea solisilvae TaxID=2072922 RepID=UPI0027DD6FC9|nr:ABC transporter permease subunit [Actinotalea solisilvae]
MTTSTSLPDAGAPAVTVAAARRESPWRRWRTPLAVGVWLLVWQGAAVAVGRDVLLVGPMDVLVRLGEIAPTADFWATVAHTSLRVGGGFALGVVAGTLLAVAAAAAPLVDALTAPLLGAVRSTPVVSFIILVLLWADSGRLALVVSALMVLPVVQLNVLAGIRARDGALLEVARVFRVPALRRVRAVDLPAVAPFLVAACRIGVGLAWRSGVAAEVIGLPDGSIGERLYDAKLFLSTADVLAWTLVVVLLGMACERLVVVLARRVPGGAPSAGAPPGRR